MVHARLTKKKLMTYKEGTCFKTVYSCALFNWFKVTKLRNWFTVLKNTIRIQLFPLLREDFHQIKYFEGFS